MVFQPIQSVSPEELVDFEDQRHLFERILGYSAKKRLMFIQAPGMCGKTSLLRMMRFHCEQKDTPWCWIDFRGQSYDNPHFTLAREMCDQLGLSPRHLAEASQPRRKHLTELRITLTTRLSKSELRDLCFDLGVDYDILPGEGTASKARELLNYLERRSRIPELVETGTRLRPDIPWEKSPQTLTGVSLTPDDLRQRYMKERMKRALVADLGDFAGERGGVACLFDSFEDISAEEEDWLLDALLCPIAMGELKGVTIVTAGRRWPKIERWEWEKCAHLIDDLPSMSVEHIKIYAQKVGVEITDEQAEFCWRACRGGNPLFMGMVVKNLRAVGKVRPRLERITPEMDKEEALGLILDELMDRAAEWKVES